MLTAEALCDFQREYAILTGMLEDLCDAVSICQTIVNKGYVGNYNKDCQKFVDNLSSNKDLISKVVDKYTEFHEYLIYVLNNFRVYYFDSEFGMYETTPEIFNNYYHIINTTMSGFNGMRASSVEMHHFRCQLSELSEELMEQLRRTDAAMETVAKEWQDEQFQRFRDEFTEDRDLIQPLSDQIYQFQDGPLQALEIILGEYENC